MVLVVLGGIGYFYYQNKPTSETREIVDAVVPENTSAVEKEIIGTKAQTVLNALDKEREKGKIQQIKSNVESARAPAMIYFDEHSSYSGLCSANQTGYFPQLEASSYPEGTNINCNVSNDGKAYALQAILANSGWCVDSAGRSIETSVSIGTKTSCI